MKKSKKYKMNIIFFNKKDELFLNDIKIIYNFYYYVNNEQPVSRIYNSLQCKERLSCFYIVIIFEDGKIVDFTEILFTKPTMDSDFEITTLDDDFSLETLIKQYTKIKLHDTMDKI